MFKRFSFVIYIVGVLLMPVAVRCQSDATATRTWEVTKYDLSVTMPSTDTDRNVSVTAVLALKNVSTAPASSLTLRISPAAEVSSARIGGSAVDFTKGEQKIGGGSLQRINIRGVAAAPGGAVSVEIIYKLKVAENTGVGTLSPAGSQFLPLSFWYPTPNSWFFARGADYAPVKLRVAGAGDLKIVSSGVETNGAFEVGQLSQPFFVTGAWDPMETGGVSVWLPKGAGDSERRRGEDLATTAIEIKQFMAKFFGTSPNSPIRLVAVRRGAGFSTGGTVLIDEGVFRRSKLDSLTVESLAESIAHLWIGGAYKVDGDGQGAIREGLPRFLATQFLEEKYGKDIADLERTRQRTAYAAVSRRDAPLVSVSPLDEYYFTTSANKGAMVWRLLSQKAGAEKFADGIRTVAKTGQLDLNSIRAAFSEHKAFLDYGFEQITDMDLMAGLPSIVGAETRVALRNTGSVDAEVDVVGINDAGQRFVARTVIPKQEFGAVSFPAANKVTKAIVDVEKLFPQLDYSNDVAPRGFDESDLLLFVKKPFDKQDFSTAEKNARAVLRDMPRFDDVRVLLGRSLLALGRLADAEAEFKTVAFEKLPTSRSLAWAAVGLGEVALRQNQTTNAITFFNEAIRADAEYGATLAARQGRVKANAPVTADDSIKSYFADFDRAAISSSKANLEALIVPGEVIRFAGGIAGQAQQWTTRIVQIDKVSPTQVIVETSLDIRMINKEPESGTAVFRLVRIGSGWKLSGVDLFEVR